MKVYLRFANGGNELRTYIMQKQVKIQAIDTCTLTHYKSSAVAQLTVSGISNEKYMYVDGGLLVIRFSPHFGLG